MINLELKHLALTSSDLLTPGKIMHREMTHILVDHGSKIEEPEVDGVRPISIEPALSKIQEVCYTVI